MKNGQTPQMRPIMVRTVKNASRLMGRVLFLIQKNEIDPEQARLLIYGCSKFVEIKKTGELETRLDEMETLIREKVQVKK